MVKPLTNIAESEIPIQLLNDIRHGKVYAFIGSGLSINIGYPSWSQLVTEIYNHISNHTWNVDLESKRWINENLNSRPDWVAEVIQQMPIEFYRKALSEIFKTKTYNKISIVHSLLALIPFKGFLTTNYDTLIEDYLQIFKNFESRVWNQNDILANPTFHDLNQMNVYKIHGCVRKDHNSIVLASSEYYDLIHDQRYIRFLDNILAHNPIITFGFSFSDRNFRVLLDERYKLYKTECAPMYCIIGSQQTCPLEIETYRNKYNIHIIRISEQNDYSELTSLLLSLFCLCYKVDSSESGSELINIITDRIHKTGKFASQFELRSNPELINCHKLLSVFQEPVDIDIFATICTDAGINLSYAHYIALFNFDNGLISSNYKLKPSSRDLTFVAEWLSSYFEAIPLGSGSRYLTIFHKKFLSAFSKTIFYLLSTSHGWNALVGYSKDGTRRLRRINEFYRQEGKWIEWLTVCEEIDKFIDKSQDIYYELLKTKVWVYFWTRRYSDAAKLIKEYPIIDEGKGQYSYVERIKYMNGAQLQTLIHDLESRKSLEYFNRSLLGRSYARLSVRQKLKNKAKDILNKAEHHLKLALKGARKKNDMIEISVQSWYLAVVLADLEKPDQAMKYLAEVKRLDESIMDRVPGKAWIRLAEYRLAVRNSAINKSRIDDFRTSSIECFNKLGIIDVENFVDNEYFY